MGYTHYWDNHVNGVSKLIDWEQAVKDCAKIIEAKKRILDVESCDNEFICLNGKGSNGHETFLIGFNEREGFCKTERKAYDVVVVAILSRMAEIDGFVVSSDGEALAWQDGVNLASKVLGREVLNPLDPDGI